MYVPTTNLKQRQPYSTNREAGICNVTMKITREMKGKKTVTIEKLGKYSSNDYSRHTHDSEESFRCKKLELLLSIARAEREESCFSAQVFDALRGVGMAEGSDRLELAGGASMTRQDVVNTSIGMCYD